LVTKNNNILFTFVINISTMKDRLVQLLDMEQLTPSKFADIIGVQRSSVSHIISGRNNPSFDFLQKTLKAFPGLKAEWLILGEGTMYEHMARELTGTLFDTAQEVHPSGEVQSAGGIQKEEGAEPLQKETDEKYMGKNRTEAPAEGAVGEKTRDHPQKSRKAVQVIVFYDDDTFHAYKSLQ
jgi:transcriptional regulator with XRE-family HTH domain